MITITILIDNKILPIFIRPQQITFDLQSSKIQKFYRHSFQSFWQPQRIDPIQIFSGDRIGCMGTGVKVVVCREIKVCTVPSLTSPLEDENHNNSFLHIRMLFHYSLTALFNIQMLLTLFLGFLVNNTMS